MIAVTAFLVFVFFASGFYMMQRRSLVKVLLGLALISNGANLLVFSARRVVPGSAPIIPESESRLTAITSDPVSQALVLTAIVISFALLAFSLALGRRVARELPSDDVDELHQLDREDD